MKPTELIELIAVRAQVQPHLVKKTLHGFAAILSEMEEGDSVSTPLGVFRRDRYKAHPFRNVTTGKMVYPEDSLITRFRGAKKLKKKVPKKEED